ncbi:MAG: N-acyl homoserine lactonase family protein [Oscillospiraceae bacterium]
MMKVYILDWGTMRLDSMIVRGRVNMMTTRAGANINHEWIEVPVWGALIDTGDHKILFDLGCLENGMEENVWPAFVREGTPWYHDKEQTVEAQLKKIGLSPRDVDTVVVSHTHVDHFGNISLFAHADVYVPKEDWINALVTMHRTSDESLYGQCLPVEFDVRVKEFHPIAKGEDFELFTGVDIITLPGHTLNLLGLVVHLENSGTLIFTSDSVYTSESIKLPIKPSGSVADSLSYADSVRKVMTLQKKYGATVMYGHDLPFFASLKKAPEFYD